MNLAASGVLTLATMDLDGRPMFWSERGRQLGYEPDVAAAVATRLGLGIEWAPLPWAEMLPCLQRGACDAICACQAITRERRDLVDFSVPYGRFDEAVAVLRSDGSSSPADFTGRRVGAIAGSSNMALVETFPGALPIPFDGASKDVMGEMAEALRSGAVDAFVDDEQVLTPYADASTDLRIAFINPTQIPLGVAFRKDTPDLRDAVDRELAALIAGGQLELIWRRWFPHKPFSV